ncbi:MAG: hypothetical protein ACREA0_26480 [bacterium]
METVASTFRLPPFRKGPANDWQDFVHTLGRLSVADQFDSVLSAVRNAPNHLRRSIETVVGRRRALCALLLAVLAAACGGDGASDPAPPAPGVIRALKGQTEFHDGIEVRVLQVSSQNKPPKAALTLTAIAQLGSLREVVLAVGESEDVGSKRFVLVGVGKAEKPYVDFRLEPLPDE